METSINNNLYECSHYKRGCKIFTRCCKKWYTCHLCHDEINNHNIDIDTIKRIKCLYCDKIQKNRQYCIKCNKCLGKYFCIKCKIYDNDYTNKEIYHCNKCNMCLLGNRKKFLHCDICDFCYSKNINHICLENKTKTNCSICLDFMHKSSKEELYMLKCGHVLHLKCINGLIQNIICISEEKKVNCPLCRDVILELNSDDSDSDSSIINTYYNNNNNNNVFIMPIMNNFNILRLNNSFSSISSIDSNESTQSIEIFTQSII